MHKRKKIPLSPDFENATKKAYDLLADLGLSRFPIDPFEILDQLKEKCDIFSWEELRRGALSEDPFHLREDGADAKTMKFRDSDHYLLVYDEGYKKDRLRWTIAHEIGHIVLGHLTNYPATAMNRAGITSEEYGVLEVEAHWFASILLAPHSVLREYQIIHHWDIARICHLSESAARKCQIYVKKPCNSISLSEQKLIRNFHNFFCNHKYSDIKIPDLLTFENGKYEDYIEFEHWNYVKFNLLRNKKHRTLYEAIYPSHAIIDESSLTIFAKNEDHIQRIKQDTKIIRDVVRTYALTKVTSIECI